jgi:ABC-2 type transport system ATP-binding protein
VPALVVREFQKRFTLVELERLFSEPSKIVRRVEAVRGVSFTVEHGQVYGFLGPNGAGKTTTIKACMDLIRPTSGVIELYGRPPGDPTVKQRIGYLPEQPYFYDYLKPQEILDFFGRLFGLDRSERKKRIAALLDRVGLSQAQNRPLRKFSKGMLQRLGIAQALLNDPDLLVLDEPMSGLDPMGRRDIRELILEERRKGKTVFFSTHVLSDAEHLCDRVAIVVRGTVRREGLLSDLLVSEAGRTQILLRGGSPELQASLRELGARIEIVGAGFDVTLDATLTNTALERCIAAGASIDRVSALRDSLESIFVREAEGADPSAGGHVERGDG